MSKHYSTDANITTIKLFGNNLTLLSKLIALTESQIPIFNKSRILVNPETKQYYIFLNIQNSDLEKTLQEISPYPLEAQS